MLETTAMVDFLFLQLKGALQLAWMEDVPGLRHAVAAGTVEFARLRVVLSELISIWKFALEQVQHTGPRSSRAR